MAEWFPKKERAFATGIFNAGSNVGAIVAPLTVPWIARHLGWQWAFLLTGAIGMVWLLFWLPTYRRPEQHPKVSTAELDYIGIVFGVISGYFMRNRSGHKKAQNI